MAQPPPQPVRKLTNYYLLGTDYTEDTVLFSFREIRVIRA